MAQDRRGEYLLETLNKNRHGVKHIRFSKQPLYSVICKTYNGKLSEKENKELRCKKRFTTRNPNREFCSDKCRLSFWTKNNKKKMAEKQKRYRDKQKKAFEKLVQDIIDSKGVQEN